MWLLSKEDCVRFALTFFFYHSKEGLYTGWSISYFTGVKIQYLSYRSTKWTDLFFVGKRSIDCTKNALTVTFELLVNQNYRPVRNTVRCIIDAFLYMKVNLTERPCYYHSNIFFSVYLDDCCKIQVFPDYFKSQNSVREKKNETQLNVVPSMTNVFNEIVRSVHHFSRCTSFQQKKDQFIWSNGSWDIEFLLR